MGISLNSPYPTCVFEHRRNRAARPAPNSFTLVEVVIAIAIIAFVLVSILGLMTYASQLVQQSDNYSRMTNITGQVLAKFDSQPFTVSSNCAVNQSNYYFTYDGIPTNTASAYYQCSVANVTPTASTLTNMMEIQMTISWPQPHPTQTNVVITSTLNYD